MATVTAPGEQRVVLSDVSWETYERLLKDLEDSSAPRLTFDRGVLEIMSPSNEHEEYNRSLDLLVELFAEAFDIEIRNLGSTTFKHEEFQRGFEPDSCFYVQNEPRVRGRRRLDLRVDAPPDLVIEIDLTSDSMTKFPLFAQLGVPEVWRFRGGDFQIFGLSGDQYRRQASSSAFPALRAAEVAELLRLSTSMSRTAWLRHLRTRFRQLKQGTWL
jgi:Uma2 family endonuclease